MRLLHSFDRTFHLALISGNIKPSSKEERKGFDNIVSRGFIDTFRNLNKEGDNYTWWSYMGGARSRNVGWRIDYFCISNSLEEKLISADIHDDILGSDHCPVSIDINI